MPEITVPVRAPELAPGRWVQGPEVSLAAARGGVVLVEFWECTCVNCLRTVPYMAAWFRRYRDRGLTVVGVHTPEFEVTADPEVVAAVVEEEDVPYPVLLDAAGETWNLFANKFWPARYLVDARGYLRYEHFGEGAYGETERALQRLLAEAGDEGAMPEPVAPVRPEDRPGAVCARPSREMFLGSHRGRMIGPEPYRPGEEVHHPGSWTQAPPEGYFTPRGRWAHDAEYLECRQVGAELELVARAAGVNLVAAPPAGGAGELVLELVGDDGERRPPATDAAGDDVELEDDGGDGGPAAVVRWERPRMLRLLAPDELVEWRLVLRVATPGARLYAVSFTGCVEGAAEGGEAARG